jgi:polar amino acid transport system substrate-binding protein
VRKLVLLVVVGVLSLGAAGCGSDEDGDEGAAGTTTEAAATTGAADACAKENLELVNEGTLTIGTDNPAYPPWFGGGTPAGSQWELNDPSTGEGFESAVAYAVAEELGFARDEVEWIVVPFNQSFKPGPKDFDFDINQISYAEERDRAVDFSESYYDVNQALVAVEGTPIADATTIDELKQHRLGAQIGTTSLAYIQENIEPEQEPRVYDTSNDVISAINAKQIDGIVVDLPTAFFVVAAEMENGTIVGQFPSVGEQERFGMVFEEGNTLRDCVNEAIAALKEDGRLEDIQQEWLSDKADAPVIE